MVDGIKRIYYYSQLYSEARDLPFDYISQNVPDDNILGKPVKDSNDEEVLVVHLKYQNDTEQSYMLWGDSYLMSDNGKTVEKIF